MSKKGTCWLSGFKQWVTGSGGSRERMTKRWSLPLALCYIHIKTEKERSKKEFVEASFLVEVSHTLPGSLKILTSVLNALKGGAKHKLAPLSYVPFALG